MDQERIVRLRFHVHNFLDIPLRRVYIIAGFTSSYPHLTFCIDNVLIVEES